MFKMFIGAAGIVYEVGFGCPNAFIIVCLPRGEVALVFDVSPILGS